MSLQPPKIDNRTYDDIVEKTVKLGQHYTAKVDSESVDNKSDALRDRTLAENITNPEGKIIAAAGTLIDEKLADAIAKIPGLTQVKVKKKGWWKPEKADAGLALIRIFGRMAARVSDRLNQVPEKNFLAFLNLIGTQILPPQPARVPLTFSLATGAQVDALVPARTQVAAPATEGEKEEVVFETERDLVVTPVQLQAVFVRQPDKDCYSDYTSKATGIEDAAFSVFSAEVPIEHSLYLACDELFTLPEPKMVTLTINSPEAAVLAGLSITWSYWDGATWQELLPRYWGRNWWHVTIANLPPPAPLAIDGLNAAWLRAKLNQSPIQPETSSLHIDQITAQVRIGSNEASDVRFFNPDLCFFNTTPIDLSKDFYPFGEQPRFNDTFYIASKEVFAKPNAKVTVDVKLSDSPPLSVNPSADLEIKWETWNGNEWDSLLTSSFSDSTKNFTDQDGGKVSFTLPSKVAAKTINGETSYWVRARITKGNYGKEASYKQRIHCEGETKVDAISKKNDNKLRVENAQGFLPGNLIWIASGTEREEVHEIESISFSNNELTLKTNLAIQQEKGTNVLRFVYDLTLATFGPPSLQSLKLSYTYDSSVPLSACLTFNDFTYVDRTTEASKDDSSFSPFTPTDEQQPSLYLGFDQPFPNQPVGLYAQVEPLTPEDAQVEPLTPEEAKDTNPKASPPRLVWEYASPTGWKRLGVQDETSAFAERGMIRFIGPPDFTVRSEFGQSLYWLRVRSRSGEFRVAPRLRRLLTNTTWASQTTTIENQILGSSNGNPNQTFRTTNSPVLLGQRLEVQEREVLSPAEQSAIEQLEGADAVTILRDEAGHPEAVRVRWHEVPDFYGSGPRDRHYTINRLTGEVLFGDGQQGMVPSQGRNNIRMSLYRIGGGERGNKGAKTVTQLKTTVPYIDSVTNLEAGGGGADLEPLERVKERGPKILRHRGRAVTIQDFEDLAYEASPDVGRVKAIAPVFNPLDENNWLDSQPNDEQVKAFLEKNKANKAGEVTLLIVPNTSASQPVPSLALIEQVETYIRARCNPTINLVVAGPDWQQISVTAEVVAVSLDVADAVRLAVIKRLEEFLHPLTGGKQGQGWAFGRQPQMSDLYAVIEGVSGVDHIHFLNEPEVGSLSANHLVYSGSHTITLSEDGV